MTPHICPSDLLCVLFSTQPISVNDEQSERCTKDDSTVLTTVCLPHGGFNSFKGALVHVHSLGQHVLHPCAYKPRAAAVQASLTLI